MWLIISSQHHISDFLHVFLANLLHRILSQSSYLCSEVPPTPSCLAIGRSDLYLTNQKEGQRHIFIQRDQISCSGLCFLSLLLTAGG